MTCGFFLLLKQANKPIGEITCIIVTNDVCCFSTKLFYGLRIWDI